MLSRPGLPPLRPAFDRDVVARLVPLAIILAGLLGSLIVGWAAAQGTSILLAPIVGLAFFIILAHTTLAPFALIMAGTSTVVSTYALPRTAHFYPVELLVLLSLVLLLFSNSRSFGGGAGVFVVVLLFTVFAGVEVARVNGIATLDAIDQARPMVIYATFWVALAALRANARRFFKLVAAFAILVVALTVAQVLLPGHNLFHGAGEAFVTTTGGGFPRVRPPGLTIVYFALIFSLTYLLWGPRRARRRAVGIAAVTAIGILISLNRNMLVGVVVGLFVVLIAIPNRRKAFVMIGCSALVMAAVLAFAGSGTIGSRILSLGNRTELHNTTLSDREYENSFAVPVIKRHLVFGIGWGSSFGAYLYAPGGIITVRGFVHNQYYDLLLRTGIVGLFAYLGLLGSTALVGVRWIRTLGETDEGWIGAGLLACVTAFAASSIVGIYVLDPGSIPIVASLFALGVVLREHLMRRGVEPDTEPPGVLQSIAS